MENENRLPKKLVDEWDFEKNKVTPFDVNAFSYKKAWWVCKKGHSFEMVVSKRVNGRNCPYCSNQEKKLFSMEEFKEAINANEIEIVEHSNLTKPTKLSGFSIGIPDFIDKEGNIYEVKNTVTINGQEREVVYKHDSKNLFDSNKFKNRRISLLSYLKNQRNLIKLETLLKKDSFIKNIDETMKNQKVFINETREYFIEKPEDKKRNSYISQMIDMVITGSPEDFITKSWLNFVSNLYYDGVLETEKFVLFEIIDGLTIKNSKNALSKLIPDDSDNKDFYVYLIFDKNKTNSPTFGVDINFELKNKKIIHEFKNNKAYLNNEKHFKLSDMTSDEEQFDVLLDLGTKSLDYSGKSGRLKFLRKYFANYSQNEFSRKLNEMGVTATNKTVARWENDTSDNPLWYRKYFYHIISALMNSDDIYGTMCWEYGWEYEIHEEALEDFINYEYMDRYRHAPHIYFQVFLRINHKENEKSASYKNEFEKLYLNSQQDIFDLSDSELSITEAFDLLKYLRSTDIDDLFNDMRLHEFSKDTMKKIYNCWKLLNKD